MIKPLKTMPLVLLITAGSIDALTLGQIHVESYLNEPLRANIDVKTTSADEWAALEVKLADRQAFAKAGMEFTSEAGQLRFRLLETASGGVIEVTTPGPVSEPFVSFVIDADWNSGRTSKDYTLLLDPPLYANRLSAPVTPANDAMFPRQSKGAVTPQATASGKTLWRVAVRNKPSTASVKQTMVAILEANPDAFIDGNMNLMKKAHLLRIPPDEVIAGIPRSAAEERFRQHAQAWKSGEPLVGLEPLSPVHGALAASPQAGSANAATVSRNPVPTEADHMRSTPASDAGEQAAMIAKLRNELASAREDARLAREESRVLAERNRVLEEQLASGEELIRRQKEELARLRESQQQPAEQIGDASRPEEPAIAAVEPAPAAAASGTSGTPVDTAGATVPQSGQEMTTEAADTPSFMASFLQREMLLFGGAATAFTMLGLLGLRRLRKTAEDESVGSVAAAHPVGVGESPREAHGNSAAPAAPVKGAPEEAWHVQDAAAPADIEDVAVASPDHERLSGHYPRLVTDALPELDSGMANGASDSPQLPEEEFRDRIDLAGVFVETGDLDGAREVLDEVMREGNHEQRNAAEGILQKDAS